MAQEYPTVLDLVGSTPIVRLDKLSRDVPGQLLAKLEFLNPGGSVKDRIGIAMIEAAERDGRLRPGGTIVEPTSGNTGVGLAMAAALKGYRCIFVMPDKMSQEKISMLRAYGAEVVITPTAVEPGSPESYYSVSDRLAEEIPGGFKPDQYSNAANPETHYRTTGPGDLGADRRRRDRRDRHLRRHRRHHLGRRPVLQGAQAGREDRRCRPGGVRLHRRRDPSRPPIPRRGDRQGHVAEDDRSRGRRRMGPGRRPGILHLRAAPGARGRSPRRRLGGNDGVRRCPGRPAPRARTPASSCCSRTAAARTSPSSTTTPG